MRWYVTIDGKTSGPHAENKIASMATAGKLGGAVMRDDAGGSWTPVESSPFAEMASKAAARGTSNSSAAAKKPMSGPLRLALSVLLLWVIAMTLGHAGLAIGGGLVVWGAVTMKKNRVTLVAWALRRSGSKLRSVGTLAVGLSVMMVGLLRVSADGVEEKRVAEVAVEAAEQKATAKKQQADRRVALRAKLPELLKEWRAALATIETTLKADEFAPAEARAALAAFTATVQPAAAAIGKPAPDALVAFGKELTSTATRLAARADLQDRLALIANSESKGLELSRAADWIGADAAYAEGLKTLGELGTPAPWLAQHTPKTFDAARAKAKLERLRKGIASNVAHAVRLKKIAKVRAGFDPEKKESFEKALVVVQAEIQDCGKCKTRGALRKLSGDITATIDEWPVAFSTIKEMQIRYADLRGKMARVSGTLKSSTYYNCRYRGATKWRSFTFSETILGLGSMHVYCSRGDKGCEKIFEALASGSSQSGSAILEYPRSNRVCAEGQALLVGWSP